MTIPEPEDCDYREPRGTFGMWLCIHPDLVGPPDDAAVDRLIEAGFDKTIGVGNTQAQAYRSMLAKLNLWMRKEAA